jgi:uncharacterized protein YggE
MKIIKLLILLFAISAGAAAQTRNLPPHIRTSGEAVITSQPDRAQIDIGVVTQASTSQAAVTENSQKLEKTLASLRKLLGTAADIKTIDYSVSPNYNYPKEGGEATIAGYTVSNIVRVILDDLSMTGKVIDEGTGAGSNRIQGLQFSLKNNDEVVARALKEAAAKARAKADALASALSVTIVGVISVEENAPGPLPIRTLSYARAEGAATPIEPGTIEVRATVDLTVEIAK